MILKYYFSVVEALYDEISPNYNGGGKKTLKSNY